MHSAACAIYVPLYSKKQNVERALEKAPFHRRVYNLQNFNYLLSNSND